MKKVNLPETAVRIKNSIDHWIDVNGDVYAINHRNRQPAILYKKTLTKTHGYKYCRIPYAIDGRVIYKHKRVNRLVAEAFIPNPENKPVVCHRNNIKSDNRKENLYWGTASENTKQAFDDGLAVNDKGFADSQSMPVFMFDTKTNRMLAMFGSISEAHRETGIEKTTISRQCKYHRPVRKEVYFRFLNDDDCVS